MRWDTIRVLLRDGSYFACFVASCGQRAVDGGYADIKAFNSDKIDKYHYISLVSGVEVAHERVWMLCDRYDETRRRARLVNTYTLIVFFCGWQNVIVGHACSEVSALTVSARSMKHQGGNRRRGTALASESVGGFRMMLRWRSAAVVSVRIVRKCRHCARLLFPHDRTSAIRRESCPCVV